MTKLSRRGIETRNKLVTSARELFEEQGFEGTSVTQIITRAEVSRGVFYIYFDSKREIFSTLADEMLEEIFDIQVAPQSPILREIVLEATALYMDFYNRHAKLLWALDELASRDDEFRSMRNNMRRRTERGTASLIRAVQESGQAEYRVDPNFAARVVGDMVDQFAHTWYVMKVQTDLDEAIATFSAMWVRAIGGGDGNIVVDGFRSPRFLASRRKSLNQNLEPME